MSTPRVALFGAAAGAAYLLLAVVSFTYGALPTIPLYDGITTESYRFVKPPKPLAEFNRKPYSFRQRFPLGPDGFKAVTASTIDNQALINIPDGAVESVPGESEIELTIEPLDPATLGSPPRKTGYDGNAYRFTARYAGSGQPVKLRPGCPSDAAPGSDPRCLTVIVHYAFGPVLGKGGATRIYRKAGSGWIPLPSKDLRNLIHAYASSDSLGTFVNAGPNRPKGTNPEAFPTRLAMLLAIGGLLAGAGLLRLTRPWSRLRRQRPPPTNSREPRMCSRCILSGRSDVVSVGRRPRRIERGVVTHGAQ